MKPRYQIFRARDGKRVDRETINECRAFARGDTGILFDRRQQVGRFQWSMIGPRGGITGLIRKEPPQPRIR